MDYEKLVRRLRQRLFVYEDESPAKGEKCSHALKRANNHLKKQDLPRQEKRERERTDRYMHLME